MTTRRLRKTVALAFALLAPAALAQGERWEPMSNTAISITGPISLSDKALAFGRKAMLALELVDAARVGRFDFTQENRAVKARIYRVVSPGDPRLLNGNTACGAPITFVSAFSPAPDELQLNLYSGANAPADASSLCAGFTYTK